MAIVLFLVLEVDYILASDFFGEHGKVIGMVHRLDEVNETSVHLGVPENGSRAFRSGSIRQREAFD